MHMSGAGMEEIGHGQGPGAGSGPGGCNPRKFSEKIALHTQRQAEDTAAFREVMLDITSIRVQAEQVRQSRGLAPYYGGSLPNVNQISRCPTETQFPCTSDPNYLTQQLLEADEVYRDIQPSLLGRPHKRHFDSAPYVSTHLSPPRGPTWRRNWSNCSATEKSQMVRLPLTALNRTNSDSALHTSVRNTHFNAHPKSAQALNPHARHSGTHMFTHPVPLIEENVQEETTSPKLKKLSSMTSSACEAPHVHNFLLPEQQVSSLPVPSALSTSGSLPDLSSLHLPSPLPVGPDSEPKNFTASLSSPSTTDHPGIMTDFQLPSLSSSLQASLSNPLLQSSLSNPNIQSSLSSHSLPSSLSSASLRLSLSNSSLQSSLSNQSLQSSLSSSSLSNQSVQSSASRSSGIGGSRSCSASSLSGHAQAPHATSSRKRPQHSPLIVPSGGESRWQHPKQFSPTVSPTLSSINQGVLPNPNKVLKETKPPAYPCSQLPKHGPPMSHQPMRQYFQPEAQHQSIPEMEQWNQNHTKSQLDHQSQQSHGQMQQHHLQHHMHKQQHNAHSRQLQHHSHTQTTYYQQLQHHSQTPQFAQQQLLQPHSSQQPFTQQHPQSQHQHHHHQPYPQVNPQFQHHQFPEAQHQSQNPWQLPWQQSQYQGQQNQQSQEIHLPTHFPTEGQEKTWSHPTDLHGLPHVQVKSSLRPCLQTQEQPKPESKVTIRESQGERMMFCHEPSHKKKDLVKEGEITPTNPSLLGKGFELNKESYVGLQLTPSQAKALSQQLGTLHKEPLGGSKVSDLHCQSAEREEQHLLKTMQSQQNQSCSAAETQNIFNISLSEQSSWLDQDISGLPDSVLEFDLETFGLDSEGLPALEDLSYAQ